MTKTYVEFIESDVAPFQFQALLDGIQYNIIITWNIFGQRYYVNVYTVQGALIVARPMIGSPLGYDISILQGMFASTLIYRTSLKQFEISDVAAVNPSLANAAFEASIDALLDAAGGVFILDQSMLGNDFLFDANGKPFVLDQGLMPSEAMLDSNGSQFVLDQSTIAATQDLTQGAIFGKDGKIFTLDQSQIK